MAGWGGRRRRFSQSVLGPPIVVSANPLIQGPPSVSLAPQSRGTPKSELRPPTVVAPVLARPIDTTFARIRPPSRICHLGAPVVLNVPSPVEIYGPFVHLAPSSRGLPKSELRPPVVIGAAVVALAAPVAVHLARSSRGAPKSELRAPPTIINLPPTPFTRVDTFAAVQGAPRSPALARTMILGQPVVLSFPPAVEIYGPETTLAYSVRGKAKPHLFPPIIPPVVALAPPIEVHLARSSRGVPKSDLHAPTVVGPVLAPPVQTSLAYSLRGIPKSRLFAPTVVTTTTPTFGPPLVRLARIRPPAVHSILREPTVVAPVLAPPIVTSLAQIRPAPVHSILRKPTDTVGLEDQGRVKVWLAYSRRGAPRSRLAPPTVVGPVVVLHEAIVHLTYSVRGKAKPRLAPPAVVAPVLAPPLATTFARITPPAVHSVLRRPTDTIGLEDQGQDRIHLAYSRRGVPKSRLSAPTVVAPVLARAIFVHLAYSLRGRPKPRLAPPAVVAPVLARPILVHLARITPPPTHPVLREPVVIDLRPQVYSLTTWLTYSRRGVPKSILRPASKFAPQPQADYTLLVHLAYSSRGKPKSRLAPPAVVRAATPYLRPIDTTLAYSSRGKAKPRLARPIVVSIFTARPTKVTLAPSRFPRPKSRLRPPTVVTPVLAAPLAITLAPQKRGTPKSILRAPAVIFVPQADSTLLIHLAYSRRGAPKSRLNPPVLTPPLVSTLLVSLAPQSRGTPKSHLSPPSVVAIAQADSTLLVHLAYSSRGVARSILRKPTVVGAGIAFTGPSVTLVRIRPPRTIWRLPQAAYAIVVCYGTVVGFDFAPEVCGDDDGATVIGSMESAEVCGDDSGATATGASAPGGSVSGGDAQREGC